MSSPTQHQSTPDHEQDPIGIALIVGAARSGTTLLRMILNAHCQVACPAETGIPSLVQLLGRVWATVSGSAAVPDGGLQAGLNAQVRAAAIAPMWHYCSQTHKRVYCDKSLDSVYRLEPFSRVFPEARYIILVRHVMDTVASGLEASPWGFNAYGYAPFIEGSVDNFVQGLASYWQAHVQAALDWEQAHPHTCLRVRYEDLVASPESVMASIWDFLKVDQDTDAVARALARPHDVTGPGDYKIAYTKEIRADSVGRGRRVPIGLIPPGLLDALNKLLESLKYEQLDTSWNADSWHEGLSGDEDDPVPGVELSAMMRQFGESAKPAAGGLGRWALIAGERRDLRWVIDSDTAEVEQGDGEVDFAVVGSAEDLVTMVRGTENPGVLLRTGRIRFVTPNGAEEFREIPGKMEEVLTVLRATDREARLSGRGEEIE